MGVLVYQSSHILPPPNDEQIKDTTYLPIIAVDDFKQAYKILDSKGMTIFRDPYTNKPYVRFFIMKRVDGGVISTNAIKPLKIHNPLLSSSVIIS